MSLWQWSTTAANNATADPSINWQEGQVPSTVNDSARAMMAAIATQFQNGWEWLQYGDVPTYVSSTQFTVPGNLTARYSVGRRVKTYNTGGTLYGLITGSTFSSVTTVTVKLDSGALDSGLSEVDVGIINPATPSLGILPGLALNEPGNGAQTLLIFAPNDTAGANIMLTGNGATTPNKYLRVINGLFQVINSANNAVCIQSDDSGNFVASGNITANSDERLKNDWKPLQRDFLEQLAEVKSGTYRRIDSGQRQVGVSAQDLAEVIPEAVSGAEILSVAYGQAALVACVELAKEVLDLRGRLEKAERGE